MSQGTVRQNHLRRVALVCNLAQWQSTLHFATLNRARGYCTTLCRPVDREPRATALSDYRARTYVRPVALLRLDLRWMVLFGPRSVDHRQGLLCLIPTAEPQVHGPEAPILGPRVTDHGPLVLAL